MAKHGAEPVIDSWPILGAIAARTSRIRIGPLVTPLARRRPQVVARQAVALDHLSSGRLTMGVGLGHSGEKEFAAFGEEADARRRAELLDESLEVLTSLWSGEPCQHRGDRCRVDGAQQLPRPVQAQIPIWVGGNWPAKRPFRRAARWSGAFPFGAEGDLLTPSGLGELADFIAEERPGIEGFDLVVGGWTDGDDADADAGRVARYGAAGLTWWLEVLEDGRAPLSEMALRVDRGPPSLAANVRDIGR